MVAVYISIDSRHPAAHLDECTAVPFLFSELYSYSSIYHVYTVYIPASHHTHRTAKMDQSFYHRCLSYFIFCPDHGIGRLQEFPG